MQQWNPEKWRKNSEKKERNGILETELTKSKGSGFSSDTVMNLTEFENTYVPYYGETATMGSLNETYLRDTESTYNEMREKFKSTPPELPFFDLVTEDLSNFTVNMSAKVVTKLQIYPNNMKTSLNLSSEHPVTTTATPYSKFTARTPSEEQKNHKDSSIPKDMNVEFGDNTITEKFFKTKIEPQYSTTGGLYFQTDYKIKPLESGSLHRSSEKVHNQSKMIIHPLAKFYEQNSSILKTDIQTEKMVVNPEMSSLYTDDNSYVNKISLSIHDDGIIKQTSELHETWIQTNYSPTEESILQGKKIFEFIHVQGINY